MRKWFRKVFKKGPPQPASRVGRGETSEEVSKNVLDTVAWNEMAPGKPKQIKVGDAALSGSVTRTPRGRTVHWMTQGMPLWDVKKVRAWANGLKQAHEVPSLGWAHEQVDAMARQMKNSGPARFLEVNNTPYLVLCERNVPEKGMGRVEIRLVDTQHQSFTEPLAVLRPALTSTPSWRGWKSTETHAASFFEVNDAKSRKALQNILDHLRGLLA